MRFPLALTTKIAAYIIGHKIRGTKKFATVLQLEPLHTCNLTCTGCGRIREYSTSLKDVMPLEDCLAAAEECNAPDGLDLWRRAAHLSADRSARRRPAQSKGGSFTSAPTRCSCAKRCANGWRREYPKRAEFVDGKISALLAARFDHARRMPLRFGRVRRTRPSRPSGRAAGCIGTSTSMVWSGRTT